MPCAGKCYPQIGCIYEVHMYFTRQHCVVSLILRQELLLGSTNAWDCQTEHHEVLGFHALPYQIVAQGVEALKNSTVSTMTCIAMDA